MQHANVFERNPITTNFNRTKFGLKKFQLGLRVTKIISYTAQRVLNARSLQPVSQMRFVILISFYTQYDLKS